MKRLSILFFAVWAIMNLSAFNKLYKSHNFCN
jgi:hypothetical protein